MPQLGLLALVELLLLQLLLQFELLGLALLVEIEVKRALCARRALVHLQLQSVHVLALLLKLPLHGRAAGIAGKRRRREHQGNQESEQRAMRKQAESPFNNCRHRRNFNSLPLQISLAAAGRAAAGVLRRSSRRFSRSRYK
jgi:hypothetical protein